MFVKPKLLIVCESEEVTKKISRELIGFPIELVKASSAEKAIEQAYQDEFAIIVTVSQLGDMTGIEVINFIRSTDKNRNSPAMIISPVIPDKETFLQTQNISMLEFLVSPYELSSFRKKIQTFLDIVLPRLQLNTEKEKLSKLTFEIDEARKLKEESEQSLKMMPNGLFTTDNNGVIKTWNLKAEAITGYSAAEVIGKRCSIFAKCESCSLFNDSIPKPHFSDECKIIRKDGKKIAIQKPLALLNDADGNVIGGIECFEDISDRVNQSEKVNKLSYAVEQSANTIVITDTDGNIEYVNSKFCKLTGYTFEEAMGKNPRILKSGDQTDKYYKELWDTITSGKEWKGEFHNLTKNGKSYWEHATIAPIMNNRNEIINYIAIKEDITKQKLAEQELRKNKHMTSNFFALSPDAVIVTDATGNIININKRLEEWVNRDLKTISKYKIYDIPLLSKEYRKMIKDYYIEGNKSKPLPNLPVAFKTASNSMLSGRMVSSVIYDNGVFNGLFILVQDITEIKEKERLLEENERRLQTILDESPVSIWDEDFSLIKKELDKLRADGITDIAEYIDANHGFLSRMKKLLILNDINHTTVLMYHGETKKEIFDNVPMIFRESSEIFRSELIALFEGEFSFQGQGVNYNLRNERMDVDIKWIIPEEFRHDFSKVLLNIQDVTERTKSEKIKETIFKVSNSVLSSKSMADLFKAIQINLGEITDTSNFYIALYNEQDDTISLPYHADEKDEVMVFPAGKTLTSHVIKKGKSLLATRAIANQMAADGIIEEHGTPSEVWLGVPLKVRKKVIGALAVQSYTDVDQYTKADMKMLEFISEQVALAILKKQNEADLMLAKNEAEAAAKAKSSFLASMSHEIRTPMNGVIGMTGLLQETELTSEQKEYVETIRVSGDSLLTIINDILDFSKIESGKMDLESHPFELRTAIEETFDLVASKAMDKGIDLLYLIDADVPPTILGDITRLRQILVNLVNNAVKFTSKGEIYVNIQSINQTKKSVELQFAVRDSGIGIPKDRLNKLFKAFSQVDSSTTRKYGGTGLGLAICKRLVNLMEGDVWVESVEGKGSTFFFNIKVEVAPTIKKMYMSEHVPELKGKRILLVDDNETNLRILSLQSEHWGLTPTAVDTPLKALELINKNKAFDIAILDMHMPEMNGYDLGVEIRKQRSKDELPLIMLSSLTQSVFDGKDKSVFDLFLTKPTKQSQLFEGIMNVLGSTVKQGKVHEHTAKLDKDMYDRIPLRILLAEDNAINQKLALRVLEKMGYSADVAGNGLEAIQALERQKYDIIFMDVSMPEMDGLEATRVIVSKWKPSERPKIIAMTANAMQGDREMCLEAGMDDYITKPIRFDQIQDALERWGSKIVTSDKMRIKRHSKKDPIMDWHMIESITALDTEDAPGTLMRELIITFLEEFPDTFAQINNAIDKNDHAQLEQSAHKLKGSAANLGGTYLASVAANVEIKGKKKETTDFAGLITELGVAFKKTKKEYLDYLKKINLPL